MHHLPPSPPPTLTSPPTRGHLIDLDRAESRAEPASKQLRNWQVVACRALECLTWYRRPVVARLALLVLLI